MITVQRDNSDPNKPKAKITVDNGDLQALDDVIHKWKFRDETGLLRFALAVMREAKDNAIIVTGEGGKPVTFAPADKLVNTDDNVSSEPDDERRPDVDTK